MKKVMYGLLAAALCLGLAAPSIAATAPAVHGTSHVTKAQTTTPAPAQKTKKKTSAKKSSSKKKSSSSKKAPAKS